MNFIISKDYIKANYISKNGTLETISEEIIPKTTRVEITPINTNTCGIIHTLKWLQENHPFVYEKDPSTRLAFHLRTITIISTKDYGRAYQLKNGEELVINKCYLRKED